MSEIEKCKTCNGERVVWNILGKLTTKEEIEDIKFGGIPSTEAYKMRMVDCPDCKERSKEFQITLGIIKCKDCRWWDSLHECTRCVQIETKNKNPSLNKIVLYKENFIKTGPNFGCIHAELKEQSHERD